MPAASIRDVREYAKDMPESGTAPQKDLADPPSSADNIFEQLTKPGSQWLFLCDRFDV